MIRLKYKCITEIVGADHLGIIVLVNDDETRQVSIPCDKRAANDFNLRKLGNNKNWRMLPEVLVHILKEKVGLNFEIRIEDIINGEYMSRVYDTETAEIIPINTPEAVLLSVISGIPIYIDDILMERQSADFDKDSAGLKLPINALSSKMLNDAIKKAVADERYELAAILKQEIDRRKSTEE